MSNSHSRWPNLFVVGAAKAGTTSLHSYLDLHPQIYMAPWKEPHFFADVQPAPDMRRRIRVYDEDSYLALFAGNEGQRYLGESSPSYLIDPQSPVRIKRNSPDAKILICLRNPVERAYSHYLMDWREGQQNLPFMEAILADYQLENKAWCARGHLYVELGMYAVQVERFLSTFGPDAVRIVETWGLDHDLNRTMAGIFEFLDLDDPRRDFSIGPHRENAYAAPRNALLRRLAGSRMRDLAAVALPPSARNWIRKKVYVRRAKPRMSQEAYEWLRTKYDPDIDRLEALIGTSLPSLHEFDSAYSADLASVDMQKNAEILSRKDD